MHWGRIHAEIEIATTQQRRERRQGTKKTAPLMCNCCSEDRDPEHFTPEQLRCKSKRICRHCELVQSLDTQDGRGRPRKETTTKTCSRCTQIKSQTDFSPSQFYHHSKPVCIECAKKNSLVDNKRCKHCQTVQDRTAFSRNQFKYATEPICLECMKADELKRYGRQCDQCKKILQPREFSQRYGAKKARLLTCINCQAGKT